MAVDFMSLLGAMMQGGATPSAGQRVQNAASGMGGLGDMLSSLMGAGSGSGMGDMLSSMLGSGSSAPQSRTASQASGMDGLGGMISGLFGSGSSAPQSQASSMDGLGSMISGLFGSGSSGQPQSRTASQTSGSGGIGSMLSSGLDRAGKAVGGKDTLAAAGVGALLGALTSKDNSTMKGIGGGIMGLLGMMAYKALTGQDSQEQTMPATTTKLASGSTANRAAAKQVQQVQSDPNEDAKLLIIAMADAAKADGKIDQDEFERISSKVKEAGIGQEGMSYIIQLLQSPMATDKIAAAVKGRPEMAVQVYIASLMAIEVDTKAERAYLDRLAKSMGLASSVVRNIEQVMGVPQAC